MHGAKLNRESGILFIIILPEYSSILRTESLTKAITMMMDDFSFVDTTIFSQKESFAAL